MDNNKQILKKAVTSTYRVVAPIAMQWKTVESGFNCRQAKGGWGIEYFFEDNWI
jgi:hypothetical protein